MKKKHLAQQTCKGYILKFVLVFLPHRKTFYQNQKKLWGTLNNYVTL